MQDSLWGELKRRNIFRVVTVYAVGSFVVLQLADILFPALSLADEDIRYVVVLLLLGLPLVVAVAWFYEITPEGLKRTTEVVSDDSITSTTGRKINLIAMALFSVAVIFLLVRTVILDNAPVPDPVTGTSTGGKSTTATSSAVADLNQAPSVAVLPLVNMSSDTENEHFADGLTEELLNALAQNNNLRVAARTSSFFYKGKNENLKNVGEALGVDHILEGSVRKAGSKVRVTVQLIKTVDGFHLWSKTFDRELTDIFVIQDEISTEVARAMHVTLVPEDPRIIAARSTDVPEAYDLYLRANEALYSRGKPELQQAITWFKEAHELDPTYGPPLLGLAEAAMVFENNYRGLELLESLDIAGQALDTAATLGFETGKYWGLRGLMSQHLMTLEPDKYEEAIRYFEKALATNENLAIVYTWYASLVGNQPGELPEVGIQPLLQREQQLLEKALALDPLNRVSQGNYLSLLLQQGKQEQFEQRLSFLLDKDPDYNSYYWIKARSFHTTANYTKALEAYLSAPAGPPTVWVIADMLFSLNEEKTVWVLMNQVPVDAPDYDYAQEYLFAMDAPLESVKSRANVMLLQPDTEGFGLSLEFRLYLEDEYQLLLQLVENRSPALKAEVPKIPRHSTMLAWYSGLLHQAGDMERAKQMAELAIVHNRGKPFVGSTGKGTVLATAFMVLDRPEEAIAEVEAAFEAGWRGYYRDEFERSPLYAGIIDDPRLVLIKNLTDQYIASQKTSFLALLRAHNYI